MLQRAIYVQAGPDWADSFGISAASGGMMCYTTSGSGYGSACGYGSSDGFGSDVGPTGDIPQHPLKQFFIDLKFEFDI
jgi:hypothetical protein